MQDDERMSDCCHPTDSHLHHHSHKKDYILYLSAGSVLLLYLLSWASQHSTIQVPLHHLSHAVFTNFNKMFYGILLGIFFVGLLSFVPREIVIFALGRHKGLKGILRATLLGVLLDLCSHGILLVGMKLYERGATLGQTMAFLIASPWNSFSLTIILFALVGGKWTLLFILFSAIIAIISGWTFDYLVEKNILSDQKRNLVIPENFDLKTETIKTLKSIPLNIKTLMTIMKNGFEESKPILKWLFIGILISALMQAYIPTELLKQYLGPSLLGLFVTLGVTTVIEICSEGSTPIAADILNRAEAPGNAFTFLMAGVATDYTEVMAIRETTKSWKVALFLPLVTVPQILLIAYFMNH